jgi:hypothetical protein
MHSAPWDAVRALLLPWFRSPSFYRRQCGGRVCLRQVHPSLLGLPGGLRGSDLLGTASRRGIAVAKPEARSAKTAEVPRFRHPWLRGSGSGSMLPVVDPVADPERSRRALCFYPPKAG